MFYIIKRQSSDLFYNVGAYSISLLNTDYELIANLLANKL